MIDRKQLLEALKCVAPALAPVPLIPILSHIWFTGSRIMAYNDRIGISTPFKTDFKGALPGAVLLDLLNASLAKECDFVEERQDVLIKAAGSKIKLPFLPPSDFAFEMPARGKGVKDIPKDHAFFAGMETCLRSISNDTTHPDQLGVTVIPADKDLLLFATDSATMMHAKAPAFPFTRKRIVLPTAFCQQMLILAKYAERVSIESSDDFVLFEADDTKLFGRLVEMGSATPFDFPGVFARHTQSMGRDKPVEIPSRMRLIVERAIIMTTTKQDKGHTKITARDGRLTFLSLSDHGEITDTLAIKHPDVNVQINPRLLKDGLTDFKKILFTSRCAIMQNEAATFLVSSTGT